MEVVQKAEALAIELGEMRRWSVTLTLLKRKMLQEVPYCGARQPLCLQIHELERLHATYQSRVDDQRRHKGGVQQREGV